MTPLFLDIGTGEFIAIVVVAAVLLGPEKIPPLAKKVGRVLGFLRHVANSATDQIKAELGPEYADLTLADLKPQNLVQRIIPSDVQDEMASLRAELAGMQAEVLRLQKQTSQDLQGTAEEVRDSVEEVRGAVTASGWNTKGGKSLYDSLAELTGYSQRSQAIDPAADQEPVSVSDPEPADAVPIEGDAVHGEDEAVPLQAAVPNSPAS